MDAAATRGDLAKVEALHAENRKCTKKAMNGAAANGHLAVVGFLHANRQEGCTAGAMTKAAANGHLDVVEFLNENREEGNLEQAMTAAAASNQLTVVRYLASKWKLSFLTNSAEAAEQSGNADMAALFRAQIANAQTDVRELRERVASDLEAKTQMQAQIDALECRVLAETSAKQALARELALEQSRVRDTETLLAEALFAVEQRGLLDAAASGHQPEASAAELHRAEVRARARNARLSEEQTAREVADNLFRPAQISARLDQRAPPASSFVGLEECGRWVASGAASAAAYAVRSTAKNLFAKQKECAICLESVSAGGWRLILPTTAPSATTKCGHVFHKDCLKGWMDAQSYTAERTCPSCRTPLE